MFRIALAATLAIVIEAAHLQSQTGGVNLKETCRNYGEVDCGNAAFCVWQVRGQRARCRLAPGFE